MPDLLFVKSGTLDDTNWLKPEMHIWTEGMPFPWGLNRSTISANLKLIWEMSVETIMKAA